MWPEEQLARDTERRLRADGHDATARGNGVHWTIEARRDDRRVVAHCFWYGPEQALMMGMNPANARNPRRPAGAAYQGLEYATTIFDGAIAAGEGRTRDAEPFFACVRAWLGGASPSELVAIAPYVGARRRAAEAIVARLDPRIRTEIAGDPGFAVWAYGDRRRACRAIESSCVYLVEQVEVASGPLDPAAIAAWTLDGAGLAELAAAGAELAPHAELLFEDPARWHWAHVRARVDHPRDTLAALAPLIRALAASPIATRFYTYSSLDRLCFSASSHFPWAGELPVVAAGADGAIFVDGVRRATVADAVATIEAALAACPIAPFFGTAVDLELPEVATALARAGSAHRPRIEMREQWTRVVIEVGPRRCELTETTVACLAGATRWHAVCRSRDDAVAIALRFLDDGAPPDELARDPRVKPRG